MQTVDPVQFGRLINAVEGLTNRVDKLTDHVTHMDQGLSELRGIFKTIRTIAATTLVLMVVFGVYTAMDWLDGAAEIARYIFRRVAG